MKIKDKKLHKAKVIRFLERYPYAFERIQKEIGHSSEWQDRFASYEDFWDCLEFYNQLRDKKMYKDFSRSWFHAEILRNFNIKTVWRLSKWAEATEEKGIRIRSFKYTTLVGQKTLSHLCAIMRHEKGIKNTSILRWAETFEILKDMGKLLNIKKCELDCCKHPSLVFYQEQSDFIDFTADFLIKKDLLITRFLHTFPAKCISKNIADELKKHIRTEFPELREWRKQIIKTGRYSPSRFSVYIIVSI